MFKQNRQSGWLLRESSDAIFILFGCVVAEGMAGLLSFSRLQVL